MLNSYNNVMWKKDYKKKELSFTEKINYQKQIDNHVFLVSVAP